MQDFLFSCVMITESFQKNNMKNLLLFAAAAACCMMMACSSDDSDDNSNTIKLRNHTESGCKNITSYSSQLGKQQSKMQFDNLVERVSLKGNNRGLLTVFHENAIFTCEADFSLSADISGNTIIVNEDAPPSTNCICCYDLTSEIGPLDNKTYTLIIKNNNAIVWTHQFDYSNTLDESFDISKEE